MPDRRRAATARVARAVVVAAEVEVLALGLGGCVGEMPLALVRQVGAFGLNGAEKIPDAAEGCCREILQAGCRRNMRICIHFHPAAATGARNVSEPREKVKRQRVMRCRKVVWTFYVGVLIINICALHRQIIRVAHVV